MKNIDEAKEALFEFVDNLEITYELYDILVNLYSNFDERLFVKIMEEVKDGNISFYDFKRIFNNTTFLEESLENQEKLYREHKLMRERLEALDSEVSRANSSAEYSVAKLKNFSYLGNHNFDTLMSNYEHYIYEEVPADVMTEDFFYNNGNTGVAGDTTVHVGFFTRSAEPDEDGKYIYTKENEYHEGTTYYTQIIDYKAADIEKENILFYNLMQETDDPVMELYRSRMLKELLSMDDVHRSSYIDSMLLSVHDYIVPVDYTKVLLNGSDLKFAEDNNVDLEEMKKIKSFAAYISTFYQE